MSVVSVSFSCAECERIAATVRLLPPGVHDPRLQPEAYKHHAEDVPAFLATWRLSIEDGPVPMTVGPVADPARVAAALEAADAAALAAVNPEYANFRCPTCEASYCRDHWLDLVAEWDEGFYDATWATCPHGHRVMLDD